MDSSKTFSLLVIGVTGYIGGSILSHFLEQNNAKSQPGTTFHITALVRRQEQADILKGYGVKAVLFKGLDDLEGCRNVASNYDIVINAGDGTDDASVAAFVKGLGDRRKAEGKECYYIHTGGTSVVGYLPVLKEARETKTWSDKDDEFSVYETTYPLTAKHREKRLSFLDLAIEEGVRTTVVLPPTIWGEGQGFFSKMSSQVATLAKVASANKQAIVVGEGQGVWNIVHIRDLSNLYYRVTRHLLTEKQLPNGTILWAEDGRHTWIATSAAIAKALKSQGLCETDKVRSVSLTEGAKLLSDADETITEAIYASSSLGRSDLGRNVLGWQPKYGEDAFWSQFDDGGEFVRVYLGS